MRATPAGLQAHLDGGATTLCSCWRLDRRDGRTLGFTDHDRPISFEGVDFAPEAAVAASAVESAAGLAADSVEILGALSADAVTAEDVALGRYDGAAVRRWLVNWADPTQRLLTFAGTLGQIEQADGVFRAEALGASALLNRPLGRVIQPTCDATLGDARCGVDMARPELCAGGVVTATGAGEGFAVGGLDGHPVGWFARGRLRWTAGANAGLAGAVRLDRTGPLGRELALRIAAAAPVAVGDSFEVDAGCDRTAGTCRGKFSNFMNFRGFPHVPGEDWLTAGPVPGAPSDGGSRRG